MKVYDHIVQGYEVNPDIDIRSEEGIEVLKDVVRGIHWPEIESREQNFTFGIEFLDSEAGIDIFYCFGADYYFFAESE